MRDDRDIQRPKPASAPEKGRDPQCGKDRRSATVCPCRHVPTCHGIPAKAFQVSLPAVHLPRNPCESVPGVSSRRPPATEFPRKCVRWHLPASYLPRFPYESVPGSTSCRPPGMEFPRKCVRCLIRLPPATAVHLITGCWGFSVGHVAVFSMKRATISTPAAAEYMYLSENHDVSRMVQLRVSHVWTHLQ